MKVGKIPDGMDPIDAKKKVGAFLKSIQQDSKPNKCILCGQHKTSFCNSHSVPRMCLKNIAVNGKVLQANGLVGADVIDVEKGINNSGTFHFICNECDSKAFQDYENPDTWTEIAPTDKVLSQIALKDVLLMVGMMLWYFTLVVTRIGIREISSKWYMLLTRMPAICILEILMQVDFGFIIIYAK